MSEARVTPLAAEFGGEVVEPGDVSYDELRKVFNGMIDRRPAIIARCANTADVVACVRFATSEGLSVSVYGGGHGVTGNAVCEEGLVIDLRNMNRVDVDPDAKIARVQGGANWGQVDAATQEHGLAVTGGRHPETGVAGLVLGSGSGWIERKCGLTADNLLSVEIVTAAGDVVTASESENPELFWGTRGGGGNFGVVTEFEFQLHELGPIVYGGMLMYPAPMAADVLRNLRQVMADAPDEVGAAVAMITAPPEDFVPEPVRGQPVVGVICSYAGPVAEAEEAMRPIVEFGPPAMAMVQPMPYVEIQKLIQPGNPKGMRNYWNSDFLAELPDEAIDILCKAHVAKPSPLTQIIVMPGGGAIARVPEDAMAFGQRSAPFNIHLLSLWGDPAEDDANIGWTRELSAAMKPFTTGRAYLNFIGDEGVDRVIAAFGEETYARLQALKDEWDPENLFRANFNIQPSGMAAAEGAPVPA